MFGICLLRHAVEPVHRIVDLANAQQTVARGTGDLRHQAGDLLHPNRFHTGNGGLRFMRHNPRHCSPVRTIR